MILLIMSNWYRGTDSTGLKSHQKNTTASLWKLRGLNACDTEHIIILYTQEDTLAYGDVESKTLPEQPFSF